MDKQSFEEIRARWQAVVNRETWARDVLRKFADRDIPDLLAEVERLTRERDAAVRDLHLVSNCQTCKYEEDPTYECAGVCDGDMWQWRGLCAENGATL